MRHFATCYKIFLGIGVLFLLVAAAGPWVFFRIKVPDQNCTIINYQAFVVIPKSLCSSNGDCSKFFSADNCKFIYFSPSLIVLLGGDLFSNYTAPNVLYHSYAVLLGSIVIISSTIHNWYYFISILFISLFFQEFCCCSLQS
jgi:hypothetical protein